MFELKKPAPSNTTSDKKKTNKPRIAATKASLAREKAITAQLLGDATKSKTNRKRKLDQSETLAHSYKSKTETLKERPSWDLRGQMKDLNEMYSLQAKRLDDILNFKRELEILKNDKESQEKTALQEAASLRSRIQELERNHSETVANLHAQQRVEFQRLEDEGINFARRLTTIEVEVEDAEREATILTEKAEQYEKQNAILKESIQNTKYKFDNIDEENKKLMKEIKALDASLKEIDKETEKEEKLNQSIDQTIEKIKENLIRSNANRERLDSKIKELEVKKNTISKGKQ